MNSLEAMAMGIPCMTSMTPSLAKYLDPHPFVLTTPETITDQLIELARDPSGLAARAREGREWLERTHGADAIVERIYARYRELGWMDEEGNAVTGATA